VTQRASGYIGFFKKRSQPDSPEIDARASILVQNSTR
jgi:hypothetical protein